MTIAEHSVSVVVPCFNAEAYIGEALESVLAQTRGAQQIVVIDDGSTDASAAEVGRFGSRVRCVRQQNQGISAARNHGVALTTGDLVAFLDADDLWPADSLARRLEPLAADPALGASFGLVEQFISPDIDPALHGQYHCPSGARPGRLAGAMLVRREVFQRIGGFDVALKVGETMDWAARLDEARIATALVESVVLRRRIHGSNTVTREKHRQGDYLRVLRASIARRRQGGGG